MARLLPFPPLGSIGYRTALLAGNDGTAQTVDLMRQLVDQAITDQTFVRFAIDLVRNVPAHDEMAEVQKVYAWVLANIRFTKDPVDKEKLYPPTELLQIRAGDCDDISTLISALVMALGYPARLVTIAADPNAPTEFSHVYAEAEVPPGSGNWISLDAARPGAQFGVEPPSYYRKRIWSLSDSSHQDVSGYYSRLLKPRPRLAGYAHVGGLGDASEDWSEFLPTLNQAIAQVPADLSIASGQAPYASFQTVNTPGYAIGPAGYSPQLNSATGWLTASAIAGIPNWVLLGLAVLTLRRK
jgi:hypothetical protein